MQDQPVLIVVVGPTAVGKTAVAIELARHFKAEIVSADSRQLFREMTVGTAKPSADELQQVKHHFVNSHSITDDVDAASYGQAAVQTIHTLFQKDRFAILCGGSGLYVRAVCEGFDEIPEVDPAIREELIANFERHGISWLQSQITTHDPALTSAIDMNNPQRLMRALEVKLGTGVSIAQFRKQSKREHAFKMVKIGLELPREELYERIDRRMDEMLRHGLVDEARSLSVYRDKNALQTVGYQEVFGFLDGKYDHDEMVRLLKRNSRRYAKRQLTWFKKDADVRWFHPGQLSAMVAFIESNAVY